jgi:3-oxoacyl-[acyl-carrier protein] reductase
MDLATHFLRGHNAVVTGGTRGIGLAIAGALLDAGCSVSLCGRTEESVNQALTRLRPRANAGNKLFGTPADVGDPASVVKFFEFTDDHLGDAVDIVVNNAGIGIFKKTAELTVEDWRKTIGLNLDGVFYVTRAALERFKRHGGGYLMQISSLAAKNPFSGGAAYNASKFGLNGFSDAVLLDHRYDNVRVTSIMPGSVATEFSPGGSVTGTDWKIAPEDIADVVLSLLRLPARTLVSAVEIRPSKPKKG